MCQFGLGYFLDNDICQYLSGVSFKLLCTIADLCDHALHISHDELWSTGAAQTSLMKSPPGGEDGGIAFYIMFLWKWTEKNLKLKVQTVLSFHTQNQSLH
jgi:hypothetical protein